MLKYLKYLSLVADVIDQAKAIGRGQSAVKSEPLSVNGHRGTLNVSWTPDVASNVVASNAK